ncbi:helix-turn-helix domain-containing protein [Rhodococcus sp. USK13]|uniref:helix-turn-helix domain-containing protein n=1 Tax=Rhodococcus sp. USK13 TaxID=2806442 RepID=UPI0032D597E3
MNADEWDEIRRLHRQGSPIKHIAVQLGMSRNTVRRAQTLDHPPPIIEADAAPSSIPWIRPSGS